MRKAQRVKPKPQRVKPLQFSTLLPRCHPGFRELATYDASRLVQKLRVFGTVRQIDGSDGSEVHWRVFLVKRPMSLPMVEDAIAKADTLIEAMGWIRQFRGKTTVIKLGGSLLDDRDALQHLLLDVIFMESVGMKPVIVHGGGAAISRAMDEAQIEPKWVNGRRVTDAATLAIVEQVLAGEINEFLTGEIERLGGRAVNLNFAAQSDVLAGEKLTLEESGKSIDLGFVGTVTAVDRRVVESITYANQVPVIPSMCIDEAGQKYNVNADTAAMAVAEALGAEKLVFLSDVNGVRRDKDDPDTIIDSLDAIEATELIESGVISAGMIPKIEACLATLGRGVRKVHIIDGRVRHSLLLEIYTTSGVGTEIVSNRTVV